MRKLVFLGDFKRIFWPGVTRWVFRVVGKFIGVGRSWWKSLVVISLHISELMKFSFVLRFDEEACWWTWCGFSRMSGLVSVFWKNMV